MLRLDLKRRWCSDTTWYHKSFRGGCQPKHSVYLFGVSSTLKKCFKFVCTTCWSKEWCCGHALRILFIMLAAIPMCRLMCPCFIMSWLCVHCCVCCLCCVAATCLDTVCFSSRCDSPPQLTIATNVNIKALFICVATVHLLQIAGAVFQPLVTRFILCLLFRWRGSNFCFPYA